VSDELEHSDGEDSDESVAELVEQLGRDASRLALHEAALGASQRVPEPRRVALGAAGVVALVLSFTAAFALANWAAVSGLSSILPTWLAALVLAVCWLAVGTALLVALLRRMGHAPGILWWRTIGADRPEAMRTLQESRDEAEQALRETIESLSGAVAHAAAGQVVDAVESLGDVAAEVGDAFLEASEDVVDAIEEQVPAGGAVGQVVDVVLFPGRLGLRIATTVLKGDSKATSS
jgi:Putative Actinobacterial Holin-X, holin superfamily III